MKTKFAREAAMAVAEELAGRLRPLCARLEVAGSLRRKKAEVGDIEIVYVSKGMPALAKDWFTPALHPIVDVALERWLENKTLVKRHNAKGLVTWGEHIKLARHLPSGIPVDFFATTEPSWWNYLVCRTGPAESNTAIAAAAKKRGWKWEPYSSGFVSLGTGERHAVGSEREVFEFVGMRYQEPDKR